MKTGFFSHLIKLCKNEAGLAYIEFAIVLPVLLMLFLGGVEITRYVLIIQKLEKTVSTVANVVTQTNPSTSQLTDAIMQDLMNSVQDMMSPYGSTSNMRVIVTDVVDRTNAQSTSTAAPTVNWQFCGGGTLTNQSKLGTTVNRNANLTNLGLPSSYAMSAGEEVVIAEVYFNFQPITNQNILGNVLQYRTAVYMPRLGALSSYVPNSTISNASNCP